MLAVIGDAVDALLGVMPERPAWRVDHLRAWTAARLNVGATGDQAETPSCAF
jgi:hypothetical protein